MINPKEPLDRTFIRDEENLAKLSMMIPVELPRELRIFSKSRFLNKSSITLTSKL